MLASARETACSIRSLSNLKRIGGLVIFYSRYNHHGALPDLTNLSTLRSSLPGRKRQWEWQVPDWNLPYATNPIASNGHNLPGYDRSEIIIVYEPVALWQNRTKRNVLFADGHAKLVDNSEWERLKAKSGLWDIAPPRIEPWWMLWRTGPREPVADSTLAKVFGVGFLGFAFLAAFLRRGKNFLSGTVLYALVCGALGGLLFSLMVSIR